LDRRLPKIAVNTAKSQPDLASGGSLATPRSSFRRKIPNMNARKEIRDILIAQKMRRWSMIARNPFVKPTCPPARARKNFWRLCHTYPEIAARLGLTATSVYPPP
jgi:hypothetical protein